MGLVSQLSKRPLNLKFFPYIYRALEETIDFDEAIEMVINMVNLDETLIIVTADHSHTFTISGYSDRGSDIRGLASRTLDDGLPYSILSYANGPSFNNFYYAQNGQVKRKNLSKIGTDKFFKKLDRLFDFFLNTNLLSLNIYVVEWLAQSHPPLKRTSNYAKSIP